MQIICKFVTYAIYACNKLLQSVRYCMQIQLKWNYVSMLIMQIRHKWNYVWMLSVIMLFLHKLPVQKNHTI